ncbi:MAG TPA: ABC transporter ATP-binding protein [Jatrophihabitantaceae bacterium]|jgi:branched-chain amino acid transport system ATP-binding protein|nr:ABC transporter ATP-binding protein [Jatrophihabitantaceae bacterium]
MTAILEARNLSAGYNGIPAIRDLNLTVNPGELVALLGANGAGKTTSLMTLAGVQQPLSGEVLWEGKSTHAPLPRRARMGLGLVAEGRSVFAKLTVRENFRVGSSQAEEAFKIFPELKRLRNRRAGLLSGGEQQMVSLARALIEKPKVLLADELSLGLGPKIVQHLFDVLREVTQDGVGVLVVEQYAHLALKACDRAYVLQRGSAVMAGGGRELLGRYDEIERTYLAG